MTSKLIVNELSADTGITTITVGDNMSGVTFKTGTSNVHATGYECTNVNATGIITATKFVGAFENSGDFTIDDWVVHAGDTNTKFGFPAADTITAETGGSERLRIDSSGRVLIGTTTEGAVQAGNVTVSGTGDVGVTFRSTNSGTNRIFFSDATSGAGEYAGYINYDHSSNLMLFGTNEITRVRITSAGLFGIGVTPISIFHVRPLDETNFLVRNEGSTVVLASETNNGRDNNRGMALEATQFEFIEGGSEKARIDSSGRLLIGTTTEGNSVADDLTIAGSGDSGITIRSGTSSEGSLMFSDATSGSAEHAGWINYNHNSNFLRFFTNATERVRIDSSGRVLIGTPTSNTSDRFTIVDPGSAFMSIRSDQHSDGNSQVLDFAVGTANRSSSNLTASIEADIHSTSGGTLKSDLKFFTNAGDNLGEKLRITSAGKVLIGTTTPAHWDNRTMSIYRNGDNFLELRGNSSNGCGVIFSDGTGNSTAGYPGYIFYAHSDDSMRFHVGGSGDEKLRIDSGGRLLIGYTASQSVYSTSALQVQGTSAATSSVSLLRHNGSPYLSLGATGGSSLGAVNAVSSGNRLGQLTFVGADGTDVNTHACSIAGYVDGSVSGNTVPGRLVFKTSTGAGEVERMRIKSGGDIDVGGNLKTNNIPGRNKLINGNFHVWQRGTSSTSSGYVAADRWYHNLSGASMTFSRQTHTNPIDGSRYYGRIASTSSSDYCGIHQRIEDAASIPEGKVTISFWARGHVNANLAVWMTINYGSGGSSDVSITQQTTAYLQNDSTFRKYSLTFDVPSHSGKTFGSNSYFQVGLGQGTNTSASAWTLDISNIQLEVGSIATAFEQRTYATELALCQRYFYKTPYSGYYVGAGNGSTNMNHTQFTFPVAMRAQPSSMNAVNVLVITSSNYTSASSKTPTIGQWSETGAALNWSGITGATDNRIGAIMLNGSSARLEFDSEL